jgi:hypothetical protein
MRGTDIAPRPESWMMPGILVYQEGRVDEENVSVSSLPRGEEKSVVIAKMSQITAFLQFV